MGAERLAHPCAGHTVVPDSPLSGETIVGHVLALVDSDFIEVLWLSSERGAFTCTELIGDVKWCHVEVPGDYEPRYVPATVAAVVT